MSQIAITGWALRTALGNTVDVVLDHLLAGKDALGDERFARARLATPPRPNRHARFLKRMGLFALEVGHEAWASRTRDVASERLGLFFGYGGLRAHFQDLVPAFEHQHADGSAREAWALGLRSLHPFFMLGHLSNNAHALFGIDVAARGDGLTLAGGNASTQAISSASDALRCGVIDAAIVVGYDTLLEPETELALGAQRIAARVPRDAFHAPYDLAPSGLCLGEGAAAIVLERSETAGGEMFAHIEAIDAADGETAWPRIETFDAVMARLVAKRGQYDHADAIVDGIGRGERAFDDAERALVSRWLPDASGLVCTASAVGHLGGASAITQAILLAGLLRRGEVFATPHLRNAASGPLAPVQARTKTRAKVAFGLSAHPPGLASGIRVELP